MARRCAEQPSGSPRPPLLVGAALLLALGAGGLERRFGPLPEAVMARLRAADAATLERWGMRLLTAHSLDEVLADE